MSSIRSLLSLSFLLIVASMCQLSYGDLVAHWPLREIDGEIYADLVAGNDGFLPSGVAVEGVDDGPPGVSESSVLFSGDSGPSFIQTPYEGIGGFEPRTIALWVKAQPQDRATALVSYGALENGRKWHFRIENTRIRTEFMGGQNFGGDSDVADGQWHHVVTVFPENGFEGDDIIHYVDGEVEPKLGGTSLEIDTAILEEENAFPVHIGFAVGHAGRWFQGQIADVRMYDEALDQAAIQELMSTPSMVPPGAPGDFNLDGTVDLGDFQVLASNFNTTFDLRESYSKGDFDLNARVNMDDFLDFRAVLNAGQAAAVGVPEPCGAMLLALAGLLMLRVRGATSASVA